MARPNARPQVDSALVKALARAAPLAADAGGGECGSITELAAAEKIDRSYLCRVLRLTLLDPEIVGRSSRAAAGGSAATLS